jgi:hypothetical protein
VGGGVELRAGERRQRRVAARDARMDSKSSPGAAALSTSPSRARHAREQLELLAGRAV